MSKGLQKISVMLVLSFMLSAFTTFTAAAASESKTNSTSRSIGSRVQTIQSKFEDAGAFFGNENAEVAFVKLGGKWGLIDKSGQVIVQPVYDSFKGASSTAKFVQRNKKWGLIGSDGKEIVPPKYDSVGSGFYDGLAAVSVGGKWGYIDGKGNEVIPLVFEFASAFDDGVAFVGGYWDQSDVFIQSFIDTSGTTVALLPKNLSYPWNVDGNQIFNEGLLWVESTTSINPSESASSELQGAHTSEGTKIITKTGVVDPKTGEVILNAEYDDLVSDTSSHYFQGGYAIVAKDGKRMIVNKEGTVISDLPQYKDAEFIYETGFNEGYAAISVDGKWGYIDTSGKEIVAPKYDEALNFSNGLAAIKVNNQWGFIDKSGKVIISPQYDEVGYFSPEGFAYVVKGEKYGFIDKAGKVVTPIQYDGASNYYDGYAVVVEGKKMGLIDKSGQVIVKPQYDSIYTFGGSDRSDLYFARQVTDFSKKLFVKGFATVKLDGKWGFISIQESASSPSLSATPTASKVLINGKEVSFEAYNIGGNNYFKLRDLAAALNGSKKSFEVKWDGAKNAISLESGKVYTPVGGELQVSGKSTAQTATATDSKIYLDGKEVQLTAYNIGGNNYFKLRDIGKLFDFGVTWNGKANTIEVDTSASYKDE
ncbi:WG repeat-containing protein [Cohnella massiliensis]|uniref:WG repeat-containing protein n=1 Tax=Cohnella massiliensis TaxID=1816691 RepID=UPI001594DFF7|nr:WG repeat-containing protein [Cohnella massiliensis]